MMWFGTALRRTGLTAAIAVGAVAATTASAAAGGVPVPGVVVAARVERFTAHAVVAFGTAFAINERGDIAGDFVALGEVHAFLRSGGRLRDLGVRGTESVGYGINDRGHVVGWSNTPGNVSDRHATLWRDGQTIDLGEGAAGGINNRDQVVGGTPINGLPRAFLWENGTRTLLDTPAGSGSGATAINDRGDIVGYVAGLPARWRGGALELLPGPPDGTPAIAADVNELGDVLIHAEKDFDNQGYLLIGERLRPLGIPPGADGFFPRGLNDRDEVVGDGNLGTGARLWRDGRFIALHGVGVNSPEVHDINNRGVMVGVALVNGAQTSAAVSWS
jgi:probable HAF family extracellular repeat protein